MDFGRSLRIWTLEIFDRKRRGIVVGSDCDMKYVITIAEKVGRF